MIDNYNLTIQKLFSLQQFGIKLGLENIKKFLDYLRNPQDKLKCFHIAGSNGKGSTASFIASMLMENGYKTGLYTSPHFVRFNERIKINNKEIEDDYIVDFFSKYESYIFENKLTFFETTTALAFQYFYDNKIDYAVIETGLGGRLDATNVINPLAVVITSISLEHTNILGKTIPEITNEKAAIIKPNCKVFVGLLPDEATNIIEQKSQQLNCEFFSLQDFIIIRENYIELYTEELDIDRLQTPLKGFYQRYNAALAALVVNETIDIHNPHTIERGIKNVIKNTGISGRYEIINNNPTVILDSSHNHEGVSSFISEFKKEMNKYNSRSLLFTALKDKAIDLMLKELQPYFNEFYFTELKMERATPINDLLTIAKSVNIFPTIIENPSEFIKNFINNNKKDDCLVVLGSMYLLGEIKNNLNTNFNN